MLQSYLIIICIYTEIAQQTPSAWNQGRIQRFRMSKVQIQKILIKNPLDKKSQNLVPPNVKINCEGCSNGSVTSKTDFSRYEKIAFNLDFAVTFLFRFWNKIRLIGISFRSPKIHFYCSFPLNYILFHQIDFNWIYLTCVAYQKKISIYSVTVQCSEGQWIDPEKTTTNSNFSGLLFIRESHSSIIRRFLSFIRVKC